MTLTVPPPACPYSAETLFRWILNSSIASTEG